MARLAEYEREIEELRDRLSRLSAAVLRVTASLDEATVLQEIVDSACALTDARYGVITTIDSAGAPRDFVTSGLTPEKHREMEAWLPDGLRFFDHLRDLHAPLRLADLPSYARSLGFSADFMMGKAFQGMPMRHRGAHVGSFFLAGKRGGGEFSDEDEELLLLFASQAATAIANARTYRNEQRARTSLEALVETSPVGVVVFDVATGAPTVLNREARRLVKNLRARESTSEKLLDALTCRFADGHEVPMSGLIRNAIAVRAAEVVLSDTDGQSVRVLVNATAIRSAEGEPESMIVTMQDLAPLDELDRLRTEFLAMVSHELRVPLTSIKGSAATVRSASEQLDRSEMLQFFRIVEDQADYMGGLIYDLLDLGRIETGTLSVDPKPTDVTTLVERARSAFTSGGARPGVSIDMPGDVPRVMADRQRIVQVLNNLLSNAARHSPESSPIRVEATLEGHHVAVSVVDEGSGVPPHLLPKMFSRHARRSGGDGSLGAGLGLAICKGLVEAHGGRIFARSEGPGLGTRVVFTIPVAGEPGTREASDVVASGAPADSQRGDARPRIVVLDDDPQALRAARDTLVSGGYAPVVTGDPRELPRLVRKERPDLVLLDLVLPGTDGIELLQRLPELADVPVIFISAYGRDETVAKALEAGAEDYIVKPYSPTELAARVRVALRKRLAPGPVVLGDLSIDGIRRRVTVAGRRVRLTATEYDLLRVLSGNAGSVVTYDALLHRVWGDREHAGPQLVRAFVKKLRAKLGDDPADPTYILNERGVGYRMPKQGGASQSGQRRLP